MYNIFAIEPYLENATIDQIAKHIYRNFSPTIKIIVALAKDNKCIICNGLSLNYKSPASLANHLEFSHKKKTMEYVRDNIMQIEPSDLEDMINHE